ncbi:hypothetical protein TrRE_jg7684, partial [Triparma retinervis]
RAPIALAPLRWNLVKLGRKWDAKISTFMAQATKQKSDLIKSHRHTMSKHNKKSRQSFEKAKEATPINKRLEMMQKSYENLTFAKQTNRAESLKRRLDPMVNSFYKKELAGHITMSRKETTRLKGAMEGERAKLDVKLDHQVDFAKRLLDCRASVNALGPNDETPLHLASGWGTKETVGLLLQCGADKTMKYLGKTPLTIAKENMREDIAKLLAGWMRVGLGYKRMAELSEPPPKDYSEEADAKVATQLRALDMKINLSGRFHAGLVHSYAKLVKMYRESDPPRWEEALEGGKRIVEIRRHALQTVQGGGGGGEEEGVSLAAAMNNLGELSHAASDYPSARRYLSAALESMTSLRGHSHQSTAPVLLNYANHLLESGDYEESRPLLMRYCEYQRELHTHEVRVWGVC